MYGLDHILEDINVASGRLDAMPAGVTSSPEVNIAILVGSKCIVYNVLDLDCNVFGFRGCGR
jgi:hypothetical protein